MKYVDTILKGIVSGILSSYLIIYGLRPAVMYPDIILETFENKWLFIILLIFNYYVFLWDTNSGAILMLCILSLVMDYILFTDIDTTIEDTTKYYLTELGNILFVKIPE